MNIPSVRFFSFWESAYLDSIHQCCRWEVGNIHIKVRWLAVCLREGSDVSLSSMSKANLYFDMRLSQQRPGRWSQCLLFNDLPRDGVVKNQTWPRPCTLKILSQKSFFRAELTTNFCQTSLICWAVGWTFYSSSRFINHTHYRLVASRIMNKSIPSC